MSQLADTSDQAFAKAAEFNCDVVIPDDCTLQLDIDRPNVSYHGVSNIDTPFIQRIHALDKNFGIARKFDGTLDISETRSRNGNTHMYISMQKRMTHTEKILLQAALGSDGMRELLSFARVTRGDHIPTLLFENRGSGVDKAVEVG